MCKILNLVGLSTMLSTELIPSKLVSSISMTTIPDKPSTKHSKIKVIKERVASPILYLGMCL